MVLRAGMVLTPRYPAGDRRGFRPQFSRRIFCRRTVCDPPRWSARRLASPFQQKRIARELISGLFLYTALDPVTRQRQRLTRRSNQSVPTVIDATRLEVSPDEMRAAII